MKCLALSDSHGNSYKIERILKKHRDAEIVFFFFFIIRDIYELIPQFQDKDWIFVKGNCELGIDARKTEYTEIHGRKIMLTHGDLYDVKYSTSLLENLAREEKINIHKELFD